MDDYSDFHALPNKTIPTTLRALDMFLFGFLLLLSILFLFSFANQGPVRGKLVADWGSF